MGTLKKTSVILIVVAAFAACVPNVVEKRFGATLLLTG